MSDTDASNPQRPELPKKRLFLVNVLHAGNIMIEAHGFFLDHGVLSFYDYTLEKIAASDIDPWHWVFVQRNRRAFAAGAWLEVEEKVTTVARSEGVN